MDAFAGKRTDLATMAKLDRLAKGGKPRVLDMFSGAGGISLGFQKAGFQIEGALEIDPLAALTHAINFHPDHAELHGRPRDMTKVEPDELVAELGLGSVDSAVDVLVGGPPCQAYARVGRAKLREIAEHPEAYKVDPRGNLFLRYLAYVKALRPLALLMENVPDSRLGALGSLAYCDAFGDQPAMSDNRFFVDPDKVGPPIPGGYILVDAKKFGNAMIPASHYGEWHDLLAAALESAGKIQDGHVGDFRKYLPEWVSFIPKGTEIRVPSYEGGL